MVLGRPEYFRGREVAKTDTKNARCQKGGSYNEKQVPTSAGRSGVPPLLRLSVACPVRDAARGRTSAEISANMDRPSGAESLLPATLRPVLRAGNLKRIS